MIPSLRNKPSEERLSHLDLFSLEKRRLRWKLIERFKIRNGFTNVNPTKLFELDDLTRTKNNGAKLKRRQVHSDCTKFLFTNGAVRDWNTLTPSVVQCNSIASFKNNLDRCLLHLSVHYYVFQSPCHALFCELLLSYGLVKAVFLSGYVLTTDLIFGWVISSLAATYEALYR